MTGSQNPETGDLATAVMTALRLAVTGNHAAAVTVLGPHLNAIDPARQHADPALIDASTLYATLTTGPDQLRAAQYAYRASHQAYPCGHPRRLAAADAYGTALHQHDRLDDAIRVRQRLLIAYRIHQPQNALLAGVGFATSLHAAGRCIEALIAVSATWDLWHRLPHGDLSTGTTILQSFIRMLLSCQRDLDLITLLCQARGTEVWDNLVITHTSEAAAANTAYIATHRGTRCGHSPQRLRDRSAWPAPPPLSQLRPARRAPADGWSSADPQGDDGPPRRRPAAPLADAIATPVDRSPAVGAAPAPACHRAWRTAQRLAAGLQPASVRRLTTWLRWLSIPFICRRIAARPDGHATRRERAAALAAQPRTTPGSTHQATTPVETRP